MKLSDFGLQPCNRRDTGWWDDHNAKSAICDWGTECELVDDSCTAVAGECLQLGAPIFE